MRSWLNSDPVRMTVAFLIWMAGVVASYRVALAVDPSSESISLEGSLVGLAVMALTWIATSFVLGRPNMFGRLAPAVALSLGWWLLTWPRVSADFALDETPILVWLGFAMAIFGPTIIVMAVLERLRDANVAGLAD